MRSPISVPSRPMRPGSSCSKTTSAVRSTPLGWICASVVGETWSATNTPERNIRVLTPRRREKHVRSRPLEVSVPIDTPLARLNELVLGDLSPHELVSCYSLRYSHDGYVS